MIKALQIPQWSSPFSSTDFTDVFFVIESFCVDVRTERCDVKVAVYLDEDALKSGHQPITRINYANEDGVFPDWATAVADAAFQSPFEAMRDWIFGIIKTNEAKTAGAKDVAG